MILVTLGTQDKPFVRLLQMLEQCLQELKIEEEVVVQAGYTVYQSERMQIFDYLDRQEFDALLKRADLIITHGGAGTIVTALKMGKKIIASPRLAQYGEHHNDHQCQLIDSFCEKGYILSCTTVEEMKKALSCRDIFVPRTFKSNQASFLTLIAGELGIE